MKLLRISVEIGFGGLKTPPVIGPTQSQFAKVIASDIADAISPMSFRLPTGVLEDRSEADADSGSGVWMRRYHKSGSQKGTETAEEDTRDDMEKDTESRMQLPPWMHEQISYMVRYWNIA